MDNDGAAQAAKQELINELLSDLPQDTRTKVDLPSECRVYDNLPTDEPVTILPMTFDDEKIIATAKREDASNLLLSKCAPDINVGSLLTMDKIYLLMKIREVSYGDDYHPTIVCPGCSVETKTVIKISELPVNPVPDDFKDTFDLDLPVSKRKVKVRLPRVKDEKYTSDINTHLWRFLVDVEGHTDSLVRSGFVKGLPLRDVKVIVAAMKLPYGVESKIKFECPECSKTTVIELPIDSSFFGVS